MYLELAFVFFYESICYLNIETVCQNDSRHLYNLKADFKTTCKYKKKQWALPQNLCFNATCVYKCKSTGFNSFPNNKF